MRAFWSIALALALSSADLFAGERDPAAAEALFRAGRDATAAGDHATACEKFKESQQLDPAAGTVLNIAICEEELGQLASAWQHYQEVVHELPPSDDRHALAKKKLEGIEPRVPKLVIEVAAGAPDGLEVARGGVKLGRATFGVPIPVDPGTHQLVVSAPGHEPRTFALTLAEGEQRKVAVEPGAALPPGALGTAPQAEGGSGTREPSDSSPGPARTVGWIVGGVGVAALTVSGVTGFMVLDKKKIVEDECASKQCSKAGLDAGAEGTTLSTVSTVTFVIGVFGVGTGAYLVLSSGKNGERTEASIANVGSGSGLALRGTF